VTAQLHLERVHRLADAARTYQVVLDGEAVSEIRNGTATDLPVRSGTHVLQVRVPKIVRLGNRPALGSTAVTFVVDDGDALV
jgi:hypothetical protein